MERYTTAAKVKLALRAPGIPGTSWDPADTTYDDLIADVISDAAKQVDEMCKAWAPFDSGTEEEARDYAATGSAVYGILGTDPYTALPTKIELVSSHGIADLTKTTRLTPYHPILHDRSGKDLVVEPTQLHPTGILEGLTYRIHATWGWDSVPSEVTLASTRIAARSFAAMRNSLDLIDTNEGGWIYAPRFDQALLRWLGPYMGNNAT